MKYGLIPEFIGRVPVFATLRNLDEGALIQILTEPKNALTKQYQRLFEMEGVKLTFTDDALSAIAQRAIKRKTGARGLRTIIENLLTDTMYDVPDMDDVSEVVIEEETVNDGVPPKIIKDKKSSKKKSSKKTDKKKSDKDDDEDKDEDKDAKSAKSSKNDDKKDSK